MEKFNNFFGSTPINDFSGLIPKHITSRKELNEWEYENILAAVKRYLSRKKKIVFDIEWIKRLHKEMFSDTWEWAGKFRTIDLNIGVENQLIQVEIKKLCDDFHYWQEKNIFSLIEQAARIHHRLVKIHPFNNGNGRLARLAGDIFCLITIIQYRGGRMISLYQIQDTDGSIYRH